jgi:hypothetical protein
MKEEEGSLAVQPVKACVIFSLLNLVPKNAFYFRFFDLSFTSLSIFLRDLNMCKNERVEHFFKKYFDFTSLRFS